MQQEYAVQTCVGCGQPWGGASACRYCGQMGGLPVGAVVSSAGKRLLAFVLDSVLILFTCAIGWLIWAMFTFANGQTPAKQIMGMRTVTIGAGTRAGWGRMFVREMLAKPLIGIFLGWLIVPYFWLLWDKNRQQLWDKMVGTAVAVDPKRPVSDQARPAAPYVQQPQHVLAPQPQVQLPPAGQEKPRGDPRQDGYGQQSGYGQHGGYGQRSGYGQPRYPPFPTLPDPPRR